MRSLLVMLVVVTVTSPVVMARQDSGLIYQNGQQNGQQPNGQNQQLPPRQNDPIPAFLPRPFPELSAEHRQYVDQLLEYWEFSSSQIDMFECGFNRWEFNAVFGPPRDANGEMQAKTISNGVIKFKTPDKGYFSVDNIWQFTGTQNPEESPYSFSELKERWICDGTFVYEFDFPNSNMIKRELPPDLQGQGLVNGPLPFLFGAKKDDINSRYWIRVITPEETEGEYWLEAYPKYPTDARNYYKVVVILDTADFLPKAIEIFDPNYHPQTNPSRSVFEFAERKIYEENRTPIDFIRNIFGSEFFEPDLPSGWELMVQPYREAAIDPNLTDGQYPRQ